MTTEDRISDNDLKKAYLQAAKVVAEHGEKYLPIFERMQEEYQIQQKKSALIKRAVSLANKADI